MKLFKSIILCALACVTLGLTSCDDYLDVNKNTDAPDYVEGYLYLAGIQQAYQGIYWDLRAIAPLTQMMGTSTTTPRPAMPVVKHGAWFTGTRV